MRAIADNGRFVLAEDGPRLLFVERRGLVPAWAVYVAGLLTVILTANAAIAVGFGVSRRDGTLTVGLVLFVVAALAGWGCVALVRRRIARRDRALDPAEAILVLDLEARVLRDASGRQLATLAEVRLARRRQLTSSSQALHVVWPRGDWAVYRGDPFTGSIDDPIQQLQQRGIRVT